MGDGHLELLQVRKAEVRERASEHEAQHAGSEVAEKDSWYSGSSYHQQSGYYTNPGYGGGGAYHSSSYHEGGVPHDDGDGRRRYTHAYNHQGPGGSKQTTITRCGSN